MRSRASDSRASSSRRNAAFDDVIRTRIVEGASPGRRRPAYVAEDDRWDDDLRPIVLQIARQQRVNTHRPPRRTAPATSRLEANKAHSPAGTLRVLRMERNGPARRSKVARSALAAALAAHRKERCVAFATRGGRWLASRKTDMKFEPRSVHGGREPRR